VDGLANLGDLLGQVGLTGGDLSREERSAGPATARDGIFNFALPISEEGGINQGMGGG
jgi:hypothetical protein